MKAFLLAAGYGTRLRPYTASVPKCLLPVRGVPILKIWLELCARYRISEVLVNTHAHAAAVADFVRDWKDGVAVRVVEEQQLFGSAGTLRANRKWVESENGFWVFYADVLTSLDLNQMLRFHSPTMAATLGVCPVPDPERCGVVDLDRSGTVLNFVEKPARPSSNLAFAGVMIGTRQLLDAIPDKPGADIAFDVLPRLIGRMRGYRIFDYLLDIGTRENYEQAQQTWPGLPEPALETPAR
ncbi:MAG: nucleotidyltransferase family protein [Acidobacteria bacterium]|nr:nucleotidyltransferase family protein [Acidobacteriota bacterium]MBV9625383.1 nucleotidyltransferase family protein [Acidobacteriota bacterium]